MKVPVRALTTAVAAAAGTVLLTYLLKAALDAAGRMDAFSAAAGLTRSQIFWVIASVEIVGVVFWSGVGTGSRYEPPLEAAMKVMPKEEAAHVSTH